MKDKSVLYLVVPCYNEEAVLDETAKQLSRKMEGLVDSGKISADSRILFVNDGSKDQTWMIICRLRRRQIIIHVWSFEPSLTNKIRLSALIFPLSTSPSIFLLSCFAVSSRTASSL